MIRLSGAVRWSGTYLTQPAIIVSKYTGAELWVFKAETEEWQRKDKFLSMAKLAVAYKDSGALTPEL